MFCNDLLALDSEWLKKTHFINYDHTRESLNQMFLGLFFKYEQPVQDLTYAQTFCQEYECKLTLESCKKQFLNHLIENEGNILNKETEVESYIAISKRVEQTVQKVEKIRKLREEIESKIEMYKDAARHAVTLFNATQYLHRINPMYVFSLQWFNQILLSSLENSNKSKEIQKRLRFIRDHLTFNLSCHVKNAMQRKHRLLFSFLLTIELAIEDGTLDAKSLNLFYKLRTLLRDKDRAGLQNDSDLALLKFLHECELNDSSFQGIVQDYKTNQRWKIVRDAKEPDNLPLHEPWYTNLDPLKRLLVIAAIRGDKLLELIHTYVSDNVGYKFVEPVKFDISRSISNISSDQPLIFIESGCHDSRIQIDEFATSKGKSLQTFTMGNKVNKILSFYRVETAFKLLGSRKQGRNVPVRAKAPTKHMDCSGQLSQNSEFFTL